jgi:Rrf2 family iron-sulfur cluster assembly transcriptional regulator
MLSQTADYALRALLLLARQPANRYNLSAGEIDAATGAPANYMSKVLNTIAKAGLVTSARGPAGGFRLALSSESIVLSRVIDLFDTSRANPRCMLGSGACNPSAPCAAHHSWESVLDARRSPLTTTTIADLLHGHTGGAIASPATSHTR